MIRVAHDVAYMTDDMIACAYTTELISHRQRVMPPFDSTMIITRQANVWRATELKSGLTANHRHLLHATPQSDAPFQPAADVQATSEGRRP